ncbi:hypothetical protein GCM10009037_15280 [Halarchaeum grantii]|uniref:DUF7310 domain-containing protein n=1 Tax=Halarchaeum grantii TaxID=1193105 RepID=A0A830EWU3_9EURY|nr:hypothetical protein [Halarchaeum grantii]GGL32578.1 hypothetical protein GCM10009037_15280 [Halarchaeum grantii]
MPPETPRPETAHRETRRDARAPDVASLDARLRAVERLAHDTDPGGDTPADDIAALADRLDTVERRLDDLDAATQALQGYVGDFEAVNESVERRANAALAAAERPPAAHPIPDLPDPDPTPEPAQNADSRDAGFLARLLGK